MIDRGLTEAASYSSLKPLSPTLKNVRVSGSSEGYLEVQYEQTTQQTCDNTHMNTGHNPEENLGEDVSSAHNDVNQGANQGVNQDCGELATNSCSVGDSSKIDNITDSSLDQKVEQEGAVKRETSEGPNTVVKRGPLDSGFGTRRRKGKALMMITDEEQEVCDPDENLNTESDTQGAAPSDDEAIDCDSDLHNTSVEIHYKPVIGDIDVLTHAEAVQEVESMETDQAILGKSPRQHGFLASQHPLDYVEDITSVTSVQSLDLVKGKM